MFDKTYIQEEYAKYMNHAVDDSSVCDALKDIIGKQKILLLAPGKSLIRETERINNLIASDEFFTVSINFVPKYFRVNLAFISNYEEV